MNNKIQIIPILISFALLGMLVYVSDVNEIISVLSNTNFFFIFLGLSIWPINSVLRAARWRYILKKSGIEIPFKSAYKVYLAGEFVSNITPAKVGDPIRNVILKKVEGKDFGLSLSATIVERIFDVLTVTIISFIGVFLLSAVLSGVIEWLILSALIIGIGVIFVIVVLRSKSLLKKILKILIKLFSFIPQVKKLEKKILKFADDLHSTFVMFKDKKMWLVTFLWTNVIWILEGIILFIAFVALGLEVTLLSAIVIVPLSAIVGVLFILPGGLGPSELTLVAFFTVLFNLSLAQITSAALVGRLLSFWIFVIVGAIVLATMKYKYKL